MKKDKRQPLTPYIPLVDFIAGIVGPNCEVVLHDIQNLDESIIAIKNEHISGRKLGGPLTDFGLKILKNKSFEKTDYLLNYQNKSKDGRSLRSSTFFIKDHNKNLIGMLCINIDLTAPIVAKNFIDNFIIGEKKNQIGDFLPINTSTQTDSTENLTKSIDELICTIIENTINGYAIPPERLSPDEKQNIIRKLNEKGVFLLKGAVSKVAAHLKVSENTVYRYLNKIN